jgi:hypothetical protein
MTDQTASSPGSNAAGNADVVSQMVPSPFTIGPDGEADAPSAGDEAGDDEAGDDEAGAAVAATAVWLG